MKIHYLSEGVVSVAKTMAVIDGGIVVNMIWCSDYTPETDIRKDPEDRPVGIGDTYADGRWYRDGVEILTQLEQAQQELAYLQSQIADMDASYREGVNSV